MRTKTKKIVAACLCGALAFGGLTGCGNANEKNKVVFSEEQTSEIKDQNLKEVADFSYRSLRALTEQEAGSVVYSPVGLYLGISLLEEGSVGKANQELSKMLGAMSSEDRQLTAAWFLQNLEANLKETTTDLNFADSIWCDEGLVVDKEYLKRVQQYYRALVVKQDMEETQGLKRVNKWISKATEEHITNILKEIPKDTKMMMIQAADLDALWKNPFRKNNTENQPFYTSNGTAAELPFMREVMSKETYLSFAEGTGIVLPFEDGNLSMTLLLPKEGSNVETLLASLSADKMGEILKGGAPAVVDLALPRFEVKNNLELTDTVKAMGLSQIFDEKNADLSGIGAYEDNTNLYVTDILHSSVISVTETGLRNHEAKDEELKSEDPKQAEEAEELCFNRPFVYLILDESNQVPILAGIYDGNK